MNKLLVGWRPYVIAVVVLGAIAVAVFYGTLHRNDDRFGDPSTLSQIKSSTDCDALRDWSDAVLTADPDDNEAFDKAVGYSNAANDRMKQIGC